MATGFQGCIGCIDCTHVPPSKDPLNTNPEYIYINRKGYHSINVQLVEYLYSTNFTSKFTCTIYLYLNK